jgi:hypothetical protein
MFGRTYVRESLLWIVACILAMEVAKWLAGALPAESSWRPLAIAPVVLALCAGLWVELRQVVRMDEMQRFIYLVATLTGAMFVMMFSAVAYTGEALKLWPRVAPVYAIGALGLGFWLGWLGAKRRYA